MESATAATWQIPEQHFILLKGNLAAAEKLLAERL